MSLSAAVPARSLLWGQAQEQMYKKPRRFSPRVAAGSPGCLNLRPLPAPCPARWPRTPCDTQPVAIFAPSDSSGLWLHRPGAAPGRGGVLTALPGCALCDEPQAPHRLRALPGASPAHCDEPRDTLCLLPCPAHPQQPVMCPGHCTGPLSLALTRTSPAACDEPWVPHRLSAPCPDQNIPGQPVMSLRMLCACCPAQSISSTL